MLPRLALLPIGVFIIWCFVVSRWYVCHIKQLCGDTETPVVTPPDEPEVDDRALVFKWDDATPITRETFEAFKNGQVNGLGEGQLLEIVGTYFPGENSPEGFANMGLARARKVRDLFIPPLSAEQIVESSSLIDPAPEGIQDSLFEAASFAYKTPAEPDKVECIVGNNNSLTVLFPYGKSEREVDEKIEDCLRDVISSLQNTENKVSIVGHTDDAGSDEFNMGLGHRRAKHILNILVKNGVDRGRISTDSKGESQPVASNETEEGTRLNRRAVLTVVEN